MDATPGNLRTSVVRDDGVTDVVAIEEPLEIRVRGAALAVTMRTPGHDDELALGFLHGEGLIDARRRWLRRRSSRATSSMSTPSCCASRRSGASMRRRRAASAGRERSRRSRCSRRTRRPARRSPRELLAALPERLTAAQAGFAATGGLHATGLFDATGELLLAREDVGRHNAMDKVIGHALARGLVPLHGHLLCVSGRLSFELVQKAAVAGAPVLVGVGAPTSLAVRSRASRA